MPDQRLTAKSGATEVALGAVLESDGTPSLQIADRVARETLDQVRSTLASALASLTAAAEALTLAANAEQVQADVVLAHVANLIAASNQIQLEANQLLDSLNEQLEAITDTQALIERMALAMQVSFGSLEDVRGIVQQMVNEMRGLLASSVPGVSYEPVGAIVAGDAVGVTTGTETTLVQLTVPAGQGFTITGFTATGNADGRFRLYIDAQKVLAARTSPADRTAHASFPDRSHPHAGQNLVVKLTVTHAEIGELCDFEGFIHGHYIANP